MCVGVLCASARVLSVHLLTPVSSGDVSLLAETDERQTGRECEQQTDDLGKGLSGILQNTWILAHWAPPGEGRGQSEALSLPVPVA